MHTVTPKHIGGTIPAIPAKAHAHRALIAAALATTPSTILLSRTSKDIDATMASLRALGSAITYTDSIIHVHPSSAPSVGGILPHESGTTLRLLLPVSASICNRVEVDAKGRLPDRPLEPLLGEMKSHGVTFSQDKPPFTMSGKLQAGHYKMVGNVSSQFFSGLLLAAPQMGESTIESVGTLQSRDYVTLTITTMQDFGVKVTTTPATDTTNETFTIAYDTHFTGRDNYQIEGDWSNAAIWLVAAALTGNSITITGMNKDSVQADRRIMQIVEDAGSTLTWNGMDLTVSGKATKPLNVDLEQMPDLLPVLSALACGIVGESSFTKGARLRLKESDRLEAVAQLVTDLGGSVRMDGDDLYITGTGSLKGGQVDCVNDHRLVMAGALAALISENPVILKDSEAITKSYPDFFDDWNLLGGEAHVI